MAAVLVLGALAAVAALLGGGGSRVVTVTAPTVSITAGIDLPLGVDVGAGAWQLPAHTLPELPDPDPDPDSELYPAQTAMLNALPVISLTGCPAPGRISSRAAWKRAVRAQWHCLQEAWGPVLTGYGLSATEPTVSFYDGDGADSACGWIDAPAFYCSAGDGSAHFGTGHFQMARDWDLSVNEMVNHEYAHHLQALFGITAVKVAASGGAELDRRAELQATCLSAALTINNEAVDFGVAEYEGWMQRLTTMLSDDIHGSQDSLLDWGARGLYATTYQACNTWVAAGSAVD